MMPVAEIADILFKHLEGTLTEEEQLQLNQWLDASPQRRHFFEELNDEEQLRAWLIEFHPEVEKDTEQAILAKIHLLKDTQEAAPPVRFMKSGWFKYAAAAVIVLGVLTWVLIPTSDKSVAVTKTPAHIDIPPGRNGAVLTLADGRQIVLDSAGKGLIATQSGTSVVLENGKLLYDLAGTGSGKTLYNTMTTPRGRQFQVVLPDGTKVWLNAASSIRYPVEFTGTDRRVFISGEAYFDVAKDAARPFFVNADNRIDIEVMGTQFNVNAYDNERVVSATLVNGAVRVSLQGQETAPGIKTEEILKPGQQALAGSFKGSGRAARSSSLMVLDAVDMDKVTAWKNGLFNFNDASIEEVMRQLERWYDIQVVYENGTPDIKFWGEIGRQIQLKDLLEILQKTEVSYRIEEGRKLIVLNK